MNALGLIEVDGYLTGIIASDAALKAANVTLLGLEVVKAGITCVLLTGDVDAVKAAVDAGEYEAKKNGLLRVAHVIPRLDEQTSSILVDNKSINQSYIVKNNNSTEDEIKDNKKDIELIQEKEEIESDNDNVTLDDLNIEKKENLPIIKQEKKVNYQNMKVDQLRNLSKKLKLANLTNKQLKIMKKEELIKILDEYYKDFEEGEK